MLGTFDLKKTIRVTREKHIHVIIKKNKTFMFTKPSHAKPNGYPSFPRPNKQSHSFLLAYLPRVIQLNAESHPPLPQKCVHWDARERERENCLWLFCSHSVSDIVICRLSLVSTSIINIQKNKKQKCLDQNQVALETSPSRRDELVF